MGSIPLISNIKKHYKSIDSTCSGTSSRVSRDFNLIKFHSELYNINRCKKIDSLDIYIVRVEDRHEIEIQNGFWKGCEFHSCHLPHTLEAIFQFIFLRHKLQGVILFQNTALLANLMPDLQKIINRLTLVKNPRRKI